MQLLIIVTLIILFRLINPKLDKTRDGKWLLWYNASRDKRDYIELN